MSKKRKEFTISVEKRESVGKGFSRALRRAGKVPSVLYGFGRPAVSLALTAETCSGVLSHSGLVSVDISGDRKASAILKDVQRHPVTGRILHVDLQEVRADQVVTSVLILEPHGEPVGVHQGGQLEQMVHEIEIKCLPADMIDVLVVDVSGLDLDMSLHVNELLLPDGVETTVDPDLGVFQVRLASIDTGDEEGEGEEEEEEGVEGEGTEEGEAASEDEAEATEE